jgi:UPF0755 protein
MFIFNLLFAPLRRRLFLIVLAILLGTGLFVGWSGWKFITTPLIVEGQPSVDFIFTQGTSVKGLASRLHQIGVISSPNFFVLLIKMQGKERALRAGEYRIVVGLTPQQLVNMMVKGEMLRHSITFVEGATFAQIRELLDVDPYLVHELKGLSDEEVMRKLGHAGEMPEGRFAPDTYIFSGKFSDMAILQQAYDLMQKRLNDEWQNRSPQAQDLVKCPYEALIAASMIEKESAYLQELPLIAGVMVRRMQLGMPLQIDATVIYGLGKEYRGKLFENDLKKDTPFNTYTRKSLPRTPISMPGKEALHAALHPEIGSAIYYVAKGDGSHVFSDTLDEHNKAKRQYLK